jgi:DNA-binding PadR family transcriptional regulator
LLKKAYDTMRPDRTVQVAISMQNPTPAEAPPTRFTERSVLILVSLSCGSKHSCALIKSIEEITEVTLSPGFLYGALSRLEQHGLVEALPTEDRRRPYRITPAGAETIRAYLEHAHRRCRRGGAGGVTRPLRPCLVLGRGLLKQLGVGRWRQ